MKEAVSCVQRLILWCSWTVGQRSFLLSFCGSTLILRLSPLFLSLLFLTFTVFLDIFTTQINIPQIFDDRAVCLGDNVLSLRTITVRSFLGTSRRFKGKLSSLRSTDSAIVGDYLQSYWFVVPR